MSEKTIERRYDLDWLRIIAIFLVFMYHGTRLFDAQDWHIKNNVVDQYMIGYLSFLTGIGMPLFFMIAGMGAFYALKFVNGKQYVLARFVRLMIPFLFGIFTHISIQVYIERTNPLDPLDCDGNFFEFYISQYYNGLYGFGGNFAWIGLHLWFLVLLFLFSLITLPIFKFIKNEKRSSSLSKLGSFFNKPGSLFLFMILPILIEIFNPLGGEGGLPRFGGWNLFSLLTFTIYGYLLVSNEEFKKSLERHEKPSILLGVVSAVFLIIVLSFFSDAIFYDTQFSIADFLFWVIRGIYGWCGIIILFNFGRKHLNVNNKSRKFLNEIVMPFYVLHQTIIVLIGFFVVKLDTIIIVKYLIISSSSLFIILGLVLLIRKVNILRFLFGMRLKRKEKNKKIN
ncbi:MAG: acyltransferase family protein [Promethearchaeota archaeon]|jgi:peptidoglycan/LPS O-acetylase OafA/YrhL